MHVVTYHVIFMTTGIISVLHPTCSKYVIFCHIFPTLLQAGMASIVFDETEIVLNPTCALFVTMEAPRAIHKKIPDNFKVVTCILMMWIIEFAVFLVINMTMISLDGVQVLFRSIAMSRPDPKMIIDLLFASKGFSKSAQLARSVPDRFPDPLHPQEVRRGTCLGQSSLSP